VPVAMETHREMFCQFEPKPNPHFVLDLLRNETKLVNNFFPRMGVPKAPSRWQCIK
jgi:hypothetical protein